MGADAEEVAVAADSSMNVHASVPAEIAQALVRLRDALQERLGDTLASLTLYGSAARGGFQAAVSDINLLIVLARVDAEMLWAMESIFNGVQPQLRLAPYLVTQAEWPQVVRAFPTRVMEMKRGHVVLHGQDVLAGVQIDCHDLELRCRQELLNLLLRFRHLMLRNDEPAALEQDLRSYLPPLVKTLRSLLYVRTARYVDSREEVLRAAAAQFDLPLEPLLQFSAWRAGQVAFIGQEYKEAATVFLNILLRLNKALHG